MRFIKKTLLFFMIVFTMTTCKKGDEDPEISLRSRKARLTGEWKMKNGSASMTYPNYNETTKFDGSNFEIYSTYTGGRPVVYVGKYLLSLKIKKNGTFTMHELNANLIFDAEGSWSFNSGVGKEKKKEDAIFYIDQVNTGSTADHIFNRWSTNFTYKIKKLTNKEIIISSSGKVFSNSYGYISFSTDYTFTQ
jgi:hypothetical protein